MVVQFWSSCFSSLDEYVHHMKHMKPYLHVENCSLL